MCLKLFESSIAAHAFLPKPVRLSVLLRVLRDRSLGQSKDSEWWMRSEGIRRRMRREKLMVDFVASCWMEILMESVQSGKARPADDGASVLTGQCWIDFRARLFFRSFGLWIG